VLSAVQKALSEMDVPREKFAFISGIGCSSRFPYYMNTYGFHGIHGRASAIATGVKTANPELSVWQITGDGDALAIGGNHFIHAVRRNVDINIILFNNEIYGLTKGQYSPTSEKGIVTKHPLRHCGRAISVGELVIGAKGKFFARTIDANVALSTKIYQERPNIRVPQSLKYCKLRHLQ
jgi:2-oxoglutarate ferredoxin oxidoreductase subunit beta